MTETTLNHAAKTNKPNWLHLLMRALFVGLAAFILWKSLEPFYGQPGSNYVDKVQHFAAYFTLSGLGLFSRFPLRQSLLLLAILLFSGSIEILQGAMEMGRSASWADFLANLLGILAAWVVWKGLQFLRNKNIKKSR